MKLRDLKKLLSIETWVLKLRQSRRKLLFSLTLLLTLVPLLLLHLYKASSAQAAWFNDSWAYRKPITISNSGSAQTDYEIKVLSNYDMSADVTNGKVQSDFDDLRFTDVGGILLPYFIEDNTSSSLDIWVKVPSIPTEDITIYMYYGNPSAIAKSNGDEVFEFFDSFESNNLDKWEASLIGNIGATQQTTTSQVFDGTYAAESYQTSDSGDTVAIHNFSASGARIIEFQFYDDSTLTASSTIFGGGILNNINLGVSNPASTTNYSYRCGGSFTVTSIARSTGWHKMKIEYTGSDANITIDGTSAATGISCPNTGAVAFGTYWTFTSGIYFDQFFARTYTATEPTAGSPATEEVGKGPVLHYRFDEGANLTGGGTLRNDLVSYWNLDDNVSGNGATITDQFGSNNGTTDYGANTTGMDCTVSGQINGGCDFDGTDDLVLVSDDDSLDMTNGDVTLAFWMNSNTSVGDLVGKRYQSSYAYGVDLDGDTIRFWVRNSNGEEVASNINPTEGVWTHIVVVAVDNGSTVDVSFYQDGALADTGSSVSERIGDNDQDFGIGAHPSVAGQTYDGMIDDVGVWNRALTQQEVEQLYHLGGGNPIVPDVSDGTLNANHAFNDGATWANEAACKDGKCLDFDGTNDYVQTQDNANLDITNTGTIQAWIRSHDDTSAPGALGAWSSITAPDGAGDNDASQVDMTVVGNTLYYVAYLHLDTTEYFATSYSDLDGGNFSGWTSLTTPTGVGADETSSIAIDSDGVNLYFAAFNYSSLENFYTASCNMPCTAPGFSGWTDQNDPGNSDSAGYQTTDMTIVNDKMYFAIYISDTTNDMFYTANSDLDGSNMTSWTTHAVPTGTYRAFNGSTSISSDGQKLYYTVLSIDYASESLHLATSALDGSDFSSWTSLTAPDGAYGGRQTVDMEIVGNKLYYAAFQHRNDTLTEDYSTAYSDLDGSNMSSWTVQTDPSNVGANETADAAITTDGKNLYYLAFSHDTTTEYLNLASSTVTSHPVISKTDSYELIQTGGGFVFDWAGSPKSFGSIGASTWNHVAVSLDGTTMIYYVNGVEVRRQPVTTDMASNTNNLIVGGDATRYFDGEIDEVKIYPYGRSAAEIKSDFTTQSSVHGVSASFGPDDSYLSDGLVGYWKMDETNLDSCSGGEDSCDTSGNGNHGTWNGDVSSVSAKYGSGADFVVDTDYVNIVDSPSLSPQYVTVAAWVNIDSYSGSYPRLIFKSGAYDLHMYTFGGGEGRLEWDVRIPSETNAATAIGDALELDTWYHVTGTFDGSELRIYINGEVKATLAGSGTITDNGNALTLSSNNVTGLDGMMDEVRIYNRALSPAEVRGLYNWAPGPVGYWPFDENTGSGAFTTYDRSGNGNNGTADSSMTESDWVQGKYGSAINFDGSNDCIDAGDVSAHNITNNLTLAAWVNPDTTSQASNPEIITKSATSFYYRMRFLDGGTVRFNAYGTSDTVLESSTALSANTWTHVAMVYNGATKKIYINGIEDASDNTTGTMSTGSADLMIGSANCVSENFDGSIDEVKIYNYARTPAQIIEDMNAGHPAPGSPVGSAVGHWKFDEGYGDTANDSGTGSNNGDLGGSSDTCPGDNNCPAWSNSGKINNALSFDGGNDFLDTGSTYLSTFQDSFSFTGWFKPTDGQPADREIPLGTRISGSSGRFQYAFDTAGTISAFYASDGDFSEATTDTVLLSDGQESWHHVAVVVDNSEDQIKIFVDGQAQSVTGGDLSSIDFSQFTTTYSLYIGANNSNGTYDRPFGGFIDEIKIYNTALTPEQILIDMNQGRSAVFGAMTDSSGVAGDFSNLAKYCPPGQGSACTGPVGEWLFDEKTGTTTNDTSNNGNSGSFNSAPVWTHGGACQQGPCLEFDGSDDYIDMNDPTDGSLDMGTSDFTISYWGNYIVGGTGQTQVGKRPSGGGAGWGVGVDGAGNASFRIDDGDSSTATDLGPSAWEDQTWHYFTFVFDRSANMSLYVDGVFQANQDISSENLTISNSESFNINTYADQTSTANGNVLLDQVRIYNYVRSQEQISWDYNQGGPVGWWKLNECQGTTANDSGSGGNNGTISIGASGDYTSAGTCSSGVGTEAWNAGTTGKRNASLDLDGSNDEVVVTDTDDLSFTDDSTDGPFSITAWVYMDDASNFDIVNKGSGTTYQEYWLRVTVSDDLNLVLTDQPLAIGTFIGAVSDDPLTSYQGSWVHLAGTYDGSAVDAGIKLYVNGIQVADTDGNVGGSYVAMENTTNNVMIGHSTASHGNGKIDDVKIFNYELTADQIRSEFNRGAVSFE